MKILQAIILGIIQGLTEFLPISSSGHLMLFENIFGLENNSLFFNVLLHFASLLAVVIVFWKEIVEIIKKPFGEKMRVIIYATIPTVIIALIIKKFIENYVLHGFLGYGFLISAVIIFMTSILKKKKESKYNMVNNKQGFIIGVAQGIAVLPGISRSGSTICAALLQGVEREESAKFSFILSIPVIIGAMLLETIDGFKTGFEDINAIGCILGFVASFIVAVFTIKIMMKIVKKGNWVWFSLYLFVLSVFVLLNQYVLCLF